MKYKIYEIVPIDSLREIITHAYGRTEIIHRNVLEELDFYDIASEYDTIELAMLKIEEHKNDLKGLKLTVLPFISL